MDAATKSAIESELKKSVATMNAVAADETLLAALDRAASLCAGAMKRGNKVLFAGNGGSAAQAQHIAAELVGRLKDERPGLPAISLTTDTAILTALGNDYGYDEVFKRQVEALGLKGDVLVALSTSGRSKNILAALAAARGKGMQTIGLTGSGGAMIALCDCALCVPSAATQNIQEAHLALGHVLCGLIERRMFPPA
jgi:D-sedoheptulose 7-phosphate isomerase